MHQKCVMGRCVNLHIHILLHLGSLAACHDINSKFVMYFMVNTAFLSYLDYLDNLTYSLKMPLLLNRTTCEQTLPITLPPPEFDSKLSTTPQTLKDFLNQVQQKKKIFDLQESHTNIELESPSKIFFY